MAEILTISSILVNNANEISNILIVSALLIAFVISISEYKSKIYEYITNRRNKWWFVIMALLMAYLIYATEHGLFTGAWLIIAVLLGVLYTIVTFYSITPRYFSDFQNPVLRYYEKRLYQGYVLENIEFFRQESHWYLLTVQDKMEYQMLRCLYFSELSEYGNAIKALDKIEDFWLYDVEKRTVKLKRAICLIFLGNMKAALQLLGRPEQNDSSNPMVWFAYSKIFENLGDMDVAYEYMEKAKNIVDAGSKLPDWEKGEVYNNYALVAIIKGNNDEALRYMNLAWANIKRSKDMRIIHIIGSNRIVRMAICGKSREDCERALEEYRRVIPVDSVKNRIEFNNTAILLYRQLGDDEKVYNLIKDDFFDLIPRFNLSEEAHYTVSTFVMLMNGSFEHDWFDPYIKSNYELFAKLPLLERLAIFKAYMGIFQQVNFQALFNLMPYRLLYNTILHYYENDAIREIDEKLAILESNDVFIYEELITQKLGILKLLEGKEHIKKSKDMYLSLYNELYEKGLHIDAMCIMLILLDECQSPYNMEIINPYRFGRINYSDYIKKVPPAPIPLKAPDKIHLWYPHLTVPRDTTVIPLHIDVIKEHVDTVISEFRTWKHHPAKIDASIEIAHMLACLNRKEEAREFYQFYANSGVAPSQFAYWMQTEIAVLGFELFQRNSSDLL